MNAGDTVAHPEFGVGSVKRVFPEGPSALVDFGYMADRVPLASLVLKEKHSATQGQPSEKAKKSEDNSKKVMDPDRTPQPVPIPTGLSEAAIEARRAVVALRLGQVLESHVGDLSVGLESQEAQLKSALARARGGKPAIVMVEGAWGGGKTHVLTVLIAEARRQGFASSAVVMDGAGVTLWEPMQLMEALMSALRFPGELLSGGLANHLAAAVKNNSQLDQFWCFGTRILGPAFKQIPRLAFENYEVLQTIEDYLSLSLPATAASAQLRQIEYRGIVLPTLRARNLADRAGKFCDLLYDWTKLCIGSGAKGLLVVFDELDVEYASTMGRQFEDRRNSRSAFLKALAALRKENLPLVLAFAAAPAGSDAEVKDDAAKDVARCVGEFDERIVAPMPGDPELLSLSKKVLALYRSAYPNAFNHLDGAGVDRIANVLVLWYKKRPNPVPRYFIRSALEVMDVYSTA